MAADLGNVAVISPVDANNASGTMPSFLGSAAPSTLDDASRALQGAIAREWECRSYPTSSGTAPSFVVTMTVAPASMRSGQTYTMTAHAAAVGNDTVNVNALGAKTIKKLVSGSKTNLAANDFYANDKLQLEYDGTDLIWVNWQGPSTAVPSLASTTEVLTGTDSAKTATPDAIAALWEQGSDIASAGTISVGEGGYFNVTGTTTITDIDFGTDKTGRRVWLKFAGALTLTYNASTLILPTAANITTAAGDMAEFVSEGSDVVRCVSYTRASGQPLASLQTWTSVFKTADESISLDNTLSNDVALLFTADASGVYVIRVKLFITVHSGCDFQCDMTGPSGTGLASWKSFGENQAMAVNSSSGFSASTSYFSATYAPTAGGTNEGSVEGEIMVTVGGSGGTVNLRWSQNISTADNLTLHKGSYLEYRKLN